jgi:uncharacterized protein
VDQHYVASVALPVSVQDAFAYHERPGALQRSIPPWEHVRLESTDGSLEPGSRVILKNRVFGIWLRWVAEHTAYEPPLLFADIQKSGPFAVWVHRHQFAGGDDHSTLTDDIKYRLPGGKLGQALGGVKARSTIEAMFSYRHRITHDDLALVSKYELPKQTVAISGASGLVGTSLQSLLTLLGHETKSIVRQKPRSDNEIDAWGESSEFSKFEDVDAVVHLAGKSIADSRWSDPVKQEIRDSRVLKTRILCEGLAALNRRPKVLVCASAIGIYGNRGDEVLTESSALGKGFLEDVAREWEEACRPAVEAGIRVVNARIGVVLSPTGGALQKSLPPAKFFGGKLGSGKQWWSWIALDDLVGAIYHAIATESLSGPVNFVSPGPMRNADFAATLSRVVSRVPLFPAPAFALRAAMGEMADALLLSSAKVMPAKLLESGYSFRFGELEPMLRYCLGKNRLESLV